MVTACSFQPGTFGAAVDDGGTSDQLETSDDALLDGASSTARKKPITIDNTKVAEDLTDFPMWFVIDDPGGLGSSATTIGDDIYFTRPDGTPLEYERVRWTPATGHLEAWVRVTLADATDTVIELRYGDVAAAHAPNALMTWSNGFAAVWHLDDPLTDTVVKDARGVANGTALGGLASGDSVTAQLGRGFDFDGTDDEVSFTNMLTADGSHTISAWVKVTAPTAGFGSMFCVGNPAGGQSRWLHTKYTDLAAGFYDGSDLRPAGAVVTNNTSTLVHWVWNTTTNATTLYRNAVSAGTGTDANTINTTGTGGHIGNAPQNFGPGGNTPNPIKGIVDEVRIATVARSLGWLQTEHANQSSPSTFYSVGSEQVAD